MSHLLPVFAFGIVSVALEFDDELVEWSTAPCCGDLRSGSRERLRDGKDDARHLVVLRGRVGRNGYTG